MTATLEQALSLQERDDAMTKIMIASQPMTDGQMENLVDKFRAAVRRHRAEFSLDAVQQVLGIENLGMECLAPFRARVEAISNLIVRRVTVNRTCTPQEAIDATGRTQYTDRTIVDAMPRGEGEETEVIFFNLGRYVSDDNLDKEYELCGLIPADPYSLAAVNEADPTFADDHPNATHWKDSSGKWCYAAFDRFDDDERGVFVSRSGDGWHDAWWFAGLRK